jgi:ABC-type phosphate transport system permease subunit
MHLRRLAGLLLLAAGVVLLVIGVRATESFGSQVSEFFSGAPSDRAVWFMLGGSLAIVLGAAAAALPWPLRAKGGA